MAPEKVTNDRARSMFVPTSVCGVYDVGQVFNWPLDTRLSPVDRIRRRALAEMIHGH